MREVECRERELAMQEYRQRQEDIRFYMQPYDHLTGDALTHMEALRAEIKAKWNLPYYLPFGSLGEKQVTIPVPDTAFSMSGCIHSDSHAAMSFCTKLLGQLLGLFVSNASWLDLTGFKPKPRKLAATISLHSSEAS
ncbi:hypothetical protein Tco_0060155 [Tanacetum coccineum]